MMRVVWICLCLVLLGGCGLTKYRQSCKPMYAYYSAQGFEHLPEPDRTLVKNWHEARGATPFAQADELEKMIAAFRAAESPREALAVVRAYWASVKD